MRIEEDVKLDYIDVLIRPKRSVLYSRKDVNLEREFRFMHSKKVWKGIPLMVANMDTTGTFEIAKIMSKYKIITMLHKFYSIEDLEKNLKELNQPDYIAYSLGIRDEDLKKLKQVIDKGLDKYFNFICLDVPNAYLERFGKHLKNLRKLCPTHTIIAGNIATNEVAEELILNGADIVKVGIGSGAACTTRKKTGVGYPQLSATIECADAAHGITKLNSGCGLVIADGGVVNSSCIAKAFGGGADFVMFGTIIAGFEESGGELIERNGKKFKVHYGMSSSKAMKNHYGGVSSYRSSEGRVLEIPYKGKLEPFIKDMLGGLRSAATYIGARKLKEFSKRTTFIKVNRQLNTFVERYEK